MSTQSLVWSAVLSIVLVIVVVAALLSGMRWFRVETPSMGEAAPPGTLVIVQRTPLSQLHVGDIITFSLAPGSTTYTHRVAKITPDGVRTKGDINADIDAWTITESLLVGKVTHRLWGMGWVVLAMPWVILGWVLLWLLTAMIWVQRGRSNMRVLGACFVVSVVALWIRPYVRAGLLTQIPQAGGGILAKVVGTGAMPITVTAEQGGAVDLRPGQVGFVNSTQAQEDGFHHYLPTLHLTGWWLVGAILVCLTPVAYVMWRDWREGRNNPAHAIHDDADNSGTSTGGGTADEGSARRHRVTRVHPTDHLTVLARSVRVISRPVTSRLTVTAAFCVLALVGVLAQPAETQSAISATVAHPTNKAGTKMYDSCFAAALTAINTDPPEDGTAAWVAWQVGRYQPGWVDNDYATEVAIGNPVDDSAAARVEAGYYYELGKPAVGMGPCLSDGENNTAANLANNWLNSDHWDRADPTQYKTNYHQMASYNQCASCARFFPISISLWFKIANGQGGGTLASISNQLGKLQPDYIDHFIYMGVDGKVRSYVKEHSIQNQRMIESSNRYDDNAWHHLVMTDSPATGRKLYVDGQLQGSATHSDLNIEFDYGGWWRFGASTTLSTARPLGSTSPNGNTKMLFGGWMSFIAMWNRVLTPEQVTGIYESVL